MDLPHSIAMSSPNQRFCRTSFETFSLVEHEATNRSHGALDSSNFDQNLTFLESFELFAQPNATSPHIVGQGFGYCGGVEVGGGEGVGGGGGGGGGGLSFVIKTVIVPLICAVGMAGNLLTLLVLSRKRLKVICDGIERTVHLGLRALAVSDLLLCICLLPHGFIEEERFEYPFEELPAGLSRLQRRAHQHVHPDEHLADGDHGNEPIPGHLLPLQVALPGRNDGHEGVHSARLSHVPCLQHPSLLWARHHQALVPGRTGDVPPRTWRADSQRDSVQRLHVALLQHRDLSSSDGADLLQRLPGPDPSRVVPRPPAVPRACLPRQHEPPYYRNPRNDRPHVYPARFARRSSSSSRTSSSVGRSSVPGSTASTWLLTSPTSCRPSTSPSTSSSPTSSSISSSDGPWGPLLPVQTTLVQCGHERRGDVQRVVFLPRQMSLRTINSSVYSAAAVIY